MLLLLFASLAIIVSNVTEQEFLQPHSMETNSLSSADHTINNNLTNTKFSVYDNVDLGIKISAPSDWKHSLQSASGNLNVIDFFVNMTGSSGHQHTPLSSFVTLSIANISDSTTTTLDSLTKQNLDLANTSLPNFQLIESNKTSLANNPAYRIVYTFIDPSIRAPSTSQFQSMNVWTVKGDNIYTLSYSQPTSEYVKYIPIVQEDYATIFTICSCLFYIES